MARKLAANVYVGETLYKAGSTPPKEIAEQITNPKAWSDGSDADASAGGDGGDGGDAGNGYDGLSVAKLKAKVKERNESRSDESAHVKPASNKQADLVAALVADDEAQASE